LEKRPGELIETRKEERPRDVEEETHVASAAAYHSL
jgi:hypothetical protein